MRRMEYDGARALELLRKGSGIPDAQFRDGQEDAIRHVVRNDGRLLVVQKTGWGKSFVYFIATQLLREAGRGPTLLVSPLLALMRNQVAAARRMGIRAERITSDNPDEWPEVEGKLVSDGVDILLIAPERFANEHFRDEVLSFVAHRISLLVVDEVHCISDWGHDFRPDYRRIERIVRTLPPNLRLLATTATANKRVMSDLQGLLGPRLTVQRGSLARPSLLLRTMRLPHQAERLAWLADVLPGLDGHGIIYTLTVHDAEVVADWLQSRGLRVYAYTAQSDDREKLETALLDNKVKALVATTALGMGFDKPDLSFVIHYQTPGSVVKYYQQVGRAGRALEAAHGVLLSGEEDTHITDYFITKAFPTRDEVRQVTEGLDESPQGLSLPALCRRVNMTRGRIERTTKLLSLESPAPVVKQGPKWHLTAAALKESFWERVERLTLVRREERSQMMRYAALESGHMDFLVRALDGHPEAHQAPHLPSLPETASRALARQATAFLRRRDIRVAPRGKWPAGGLPRYDVKGTIPFDHRASAGRALCLWGDAGWGEMVRMGKRGDRFDDNLVSACKQLMARWKPQPFPAWVACIPSRRRPHLVPDFAKRLAAAMNLPFRDVLEPTRERPEQKSMLNSEHQAANLDDALAVCLTPPSGPVLLVDDIVGSRWTFAVAAWLLRRHGSGEVRPLALSSRRGSS